MVDKPFPEKGEGTLEEREGNCERICEAKALHSMPRALRRDLLVFFQRLLGIDSGLLPRR